MTRSSRREGTLDGKEMCGLGRGIVNGRRVCRCHRTLQVWHVLRSRAQVGSERQKSEAAEARYDLRGQGRVRKCSAYMEEIGHEAEKDGRARYEGKGCARNCVMTHVPYHKLPVTREEARNGSRHKRNACSQWWMEVNASGGANRSTTELRHAMQLQIYEWTRKLPGDRYKTHRIVVAMVSHVAEIMAKSEKSGVASFKRVTLVRGMWRNS